jgi:abhydrolase domain-containing protein 17
VLLRTLVVVALAFAGVTLLAYLLANAVLFQPPRASYAAGDLPFRRVPAAGADSLALMHLPHERARFTIIFSHGNAEDLGDVLPFLERLHASGFGVIGYDYRGYGQSGGGRATARSAAEDAEGVFRFAVDELGIPPDRLILHGRSVGSGPTLQVAARQDVAGVILESAFTSAYRVMTRVGVLPFDRFPNHRMILDVRAPVLVVHGTRDRVIPLSHGEALFALAREPKQSLWVAGAGHNDLTQVAGETYYLSLIRFASLVERHSNQLPDRR